MALTKLIVSVTGEVRTVLNVCTTFPGQTTGAVPYESYSLSRFFWLSEQTTSQSPVRQAWKEFQIILRYSKRLFVFIIDYQVYSPLGVDLNWITKNRPLQNTPGSQPALARYTRESRRPCVWLPDLCVARKLFGKPLLMLVLNKPRSRLPGVFFSGESFYRF